jgi:hypothetical protein
MLSSIAINKVTAPDAAMANAAVLPWLPYSPRQQCAVICSSASHKVHNPNATITPSSSFSWRDWMIE